MFLTQEDYGENGFDETIATEMIATVEQMVQWTIKVGWEKTKIKSKNNNYRNLSKKGLMMLVVIDVNEHG